MAWKQSIARDHLGKLLRRALNEKEVTETWLVGLLASNGIPCTMSYVSKIKNGRQVVSPFTIDVLATVFNLSYEERTRWHRAGAADYGYDIGPF